MLTWSLDSKIPPPVFRKKKIPKILNRWLSQSKFWSWPHNGTSHPKVGGRKKGARGIFFLVQKESHNANVSNSKLTIRWWLGGKMNMPNERWTYLTALNFVRWASFLLIIIFLQSNAKRRFFIEILLMQNFGGITGLSFPASALAALDQPSLCTCHTRAKEVRPFFAIFSQFWTPSSNMNIFIRWTQMPIGVWPAQSDKGTPHKGSRAFHG